MILKMNTAVLALAAFIVITTKPVSGRSHDSRSHGRHQNDVETKSECVTLTMPADAVAQILSDTGAAKRHLQGATEMMASLEALKSGQQEVKSVLLKELQANVLEDLERSEIILQLQETQNQQTQMLQKMQMLLEGISEYGVQSPKPMVNSNELVIHQSTLSQEIQNDAINAAIEAVQKYSEYEDICPFIMSAMEEEHNKYWECTVGRDYAAWVMANSGQFLKFNLGELTFRIFRVLP